MSTNVVKLKGVVVVSLAMAVVSGMLAGCGASAGPLPTPSPAADSIAQAPCLSNANSAALDGASESYLRLREKLSPTEARAQVIADLNAASNGLAEASLCADGYTIWVNFTDGQVAAINTDEAFAGADPAAESAKRKATASVRIPSERAAWSRVQRSRPRGVMPDGELLTPASRKVLLMSAAGELFDEQDRSLLEDLRDKLINDHGWEARDITIKRNEYEDDYATLRFEDFFRLKDYGVIVILAHGIYRDFPPPPPVVTPPPAPTPSPADSSDPFNFGFRVRNAAIRYYYIQVRAEWNDPTDDTDPFDFGFRVIGDEGFDLTEEMRRGRVILVNHLDIFQRTTKRYYYMREDLWSEYVETLPNSFVYVCAPNLYRPSSGVEPAPTPAPTDGSDAFNFGFRVIDGGQLQSPMLLDHGAGSVLGWDYLVPRQEAFAATEIITRMAAEELSDVEAFVEGGFNEPVSVTDGSENWSAALSLLPSSADNSRHLFLPTWVNVGFVNVPEETLTATVEIEYVDDSIPLPSITKVEDIPHSVHEIGGLFPGAEVRLISQALNRNGEVLGESEETVVLRTGDNSITVDFAIQVPHSFVVVEARDPDPTAKGGTWGWTFYLAWDAVPGAAYYDVTIDRKGRLEYEGQEPVSVERALPSEMLLFGNFEPPGVGPGRVFLDIGGYTSYYGKDETDYPQAAALEKEAEVTELYRSWEYTIQPYFDSGN